MGEESKNVTAQERLDFEREHLAQRLAEPELLKEAIPITTHYGSWSENIELAVPVGKLRRGGHVVAPDKDQGKKIARLLAKHPGFPKPRVIKSSYYSSSWEVVWGDPPPFDDRATDGTSETIMRGIHFGYTDEAIAEFVVPQRGYSRKRRTALELIRSKRSLILDSTGVSIGS
jgi:hypothetical protein